MEYYAHKNKNNEKQAVREHLEKTARLAESFSVDFLKPLAYTAGLAHDIGKYSMAFQKYLEGAAIRFEHSPCGAIEIKKLIKESCDKIVALMLEYCIVGHHTGLPDGGNENDSPDDDVTLMGRLKRSGKYIGDSSYSAFSGEIALSIPESKELIDVIKGTQDKGEIIEKYAFFTRYLFSCLKDADILDTENFCNPSIPCNNRKSDFFSAAVALEHKIEDFILDTPLREARGRIQKQACLNAQQAAAISILNMPTGSGKTLCSLKIALNRLVNSNGGIKRIIYVIPYTSIIEQTAEIFEEVCGGYVDILQHHSNYYYENDNKEADTQEKLKRATENWDAPFIITTSVQFFQSLYHYRTSGLRKLHNTADSIIIFDEIHLLPIEYLQPCLRGIGYLTQYFNVQAIFLSATMPDYSALFRRYLPECGVTELIDDKVDYEYFKKCRYINLGKTDYSSIVEKANEYESSLIVVNKRKTAREVYNMLIGRKFHLSTYMTPADRSDTIAQIKRCLKAGEKIVVVSTSLVEAGVDLNFKTVFRELAGLDNILQSAGRCNREGKYEKGDVYIFETDDKPHRELQLRANITREMISAYGDISSDECIREYYRRLFHYSDAEIEKNSIAKDCTGLDNIPFRSYAENFHFIKNETIGIVIDSRREVKELLNRLKEGDYSVKRSLQRYTVGLRLNEFEEARKLGVVDSFGTEVYVLTNEQYYSKELGLCLDMTNDIIF